MKFNYNKRRFWKNTDEYERLKATGLNGKLIKNLGEDMHNIVYEIITRSYETGDIPEEFVKRRTIALPKKEITKEL